MTPEGVSMTFFYIMLAIGGIGVVLAMIGGFLFGVFAGKKDSRYAGAGAILALVGLVFVGTFFMVAVMGLGVAGGPVKVSQSRYADVIEDGAQAILVDATDERYYFVIQSVVSRTEYDNGNVSILWRTERLLVSIDREDVTFMPGVPITDGGDTKSESRLGHRFMLRVESFDNGDRITASILSPKNSPIFDPPIRLTEEIDDE